VPGVVIICVCAGWLTRGFLENGLCYRESDVRAHCPCQFKWRIRRLLLKGYVENIWYHIGGGVGWIGNWGKSWIRFVNDVLAGLDHGSKVPCFL
jgi:hypothetical protein